MNATGILTVLFAIAVAAAISACLIRLLLPLLQRHALTAPNARSSHTVPTPQGAGIAVVAATLLSATACLAWIGQQAPADLFAATTFIAVVGLADDFKSIPIVPRLLLQAIAVGAILLAAPADLRIFPSAPLLLERGLLLLGGLWFVNLVNFMDGLDLMTVSEVVPISAALVVLGASGQLPPAVAATAAALCGAMIGFAPFNRPVARIFLGDVGSLPVGLLLGWCLLQLAWHQQLAAAILLPLYYLTDATLTLSRRISQRQKFWIAHRTHFYQRASDNGFSVQRITGEIFALNLGLGALAIASTQTQSVAMRAALVLTGCVAVAWVLLRFSRRRRC
ncbi:glycosyltransferase family 4 protein [Bradyrhizobium sp. NP1]|uniref:MraY family glycosyltransferase n=1 Tax=Bradyrhizobium sp. NP1 TaxID=3049772 RepID=UPI0025A526BA|nr:glycosyltransferase family 4 protein [Bradyrhizobium sp. NP1]WJR76303.1 glycosyltransferase family 4 protein [Bradyrhizobium sp. NP1]